MMRGMGGSAPGAAGGASPFADEGANAAVTRLLENPEFMRAIYEDMGGDAGAGGASRANRNAFLDRFGGGAGGLWGDFHLRQLIHVLPRNGMPTNYDN